ncbi:uncharacterized protein LOC123199406 [Mangifera indica]|uniref:uncharacterized protein LOC123199406 n=1 Tax=Mangifera indica TaxID=29780 RepID=UPI001CFAD38A|nr:uncharacterized protein LOC123199406 [Mangifera indica]
MDVEQPINEIPQVADNTLVDQTVQQPSDIVEPPVVHSTPQEDSVTTLRRSTRMKKSAISSDYIVYLQEIDHNLGAEDDPVTFLQAMDCSKSILWYNAMKDEMESMKSNGVWDLVKLPNGAKAIGCDGSEFHHVI